MLALKITRVFAIVLAILTLPYLIFATPLSVLFGLLAIAITLFLRKKTTGKELNTVSFSVLSVVTGLTALSIVWMGYANWQGLGNPSKDHVLVLVSLVVVIMVTIGTIFGLFKSSKYVH